MEWGWHFADLSNDWMELIMLIGLLQVLYSTNSCSHRMRTTGLMR